MNKTSNVRIIPRLDIKGPNVIKGVQTEGLRVLGSPKELVAKYYQEKADEIIYMDIVASLYQRSIDFDLLKTVTENIFIPFTVGGGIRSIQDINNALRAGADKVAINTYAINNPNFLIEAVRVFGSQCIVLSVEAKKIGDKKWEAYTEGGRQRTNVGAINWIKKAIKLGIGEIIITSIDRDGTKQGYETDLISEITSFAPIPVICHGGAGKMEDFKEVLKDRKIDAVSSSSVFHYNDFSVKTLKKYLFEQKINVRI